MSVISAVLTGMTPEMAVAELRPELIDDEAARRWVMRYLHPTGLWCPRCSSDDFSMIVTATWFDGGRVQCKSCGKWFTNRTGTPFDGCAISWRDLYALLLFNGIGFTLGEIASRLDIHPDTVSRMLKRIQERANV
ncbi:hypothetical protein MJO47_09220 [Desulfuromonas sp. KJ2020]|uniref:hypothetical protein n=1 Tax=Desulfuromonas sp. KJ2020 TaxID=2919173 RepID=UPI0020A7ED24|nr:hypothetical protein [Desulfuromonas sp. KJ2020]MCP3177277.1 hypothetical protein [Desulfuromonas sp. KJ2020]